MSEIFDKISTISILKEITLEISTSIDLFHGFELCVYKIIYFHNLDILLYIKINMLLFHNLNVYYNKNWNHVDFFVDFASLFESYLPN